MSVETYIKRISASTIEIHGIKCKCGGVLEVEDFGNGGSQAGRYEIFCRSCLTCDPNGWDRQSDIIPNARSYFS